MSNELRELAFTRLDEVEESLESNSTYKVFKNQYEHLYSEVEGLLGENRILLDELTANLISMYAEIGVNAYIKGIKDSELVRV